MVPWASGPNSLRISLRRIPNYVNGSFDPKGAKALRAAQAKLAQEQTNLEAEIESIVQKARPSDGGKKQ